MTLDSKVKVASANPLTELYLSIYVLFFRLSRWRSGMKVNAGIAGISAIVGMLVFSLMSLAEILAGHRLGLNRWAVGLGFWMSFYANYYFLVVRGSGVAFEKHFNRFSRKKRIVLRLAAIAITFVILTIFFSTVTVYRKTFGFA